MNENAIIVEKSIDPRVDMGVPLRAEFDKFGWGPLLDIKGPCYPDLVWKFFANMENKDKIEMDVIITFVKGVRIEVTSEFVAMLLGVPNNGPAMVYNNYDAVTSDPDYDIFAASQRLGYRRVRTGSRLIILPTYLPLIDRLVCYFSRANIIPRKAGNNEVQNLDIYIIDKLLNGLGDIEAIPVVSIIISHMWFVAHSASNKQTKQHAQFPILISRILVASGVNLTDKPFLLPTSRHVLTATTMTEMYFILRWGIWYHNSASRNIHRHQHDLPVPAPTNAKRAREDRVHEEEALDRGADAPATNPQSPRAPRGTHQVFSTIFDCLDNLRTGQAQLHHFSRTGSFFDDIRTPLFDRSALDELDETESSEEE